MCIFLINQYSHIVASTQGTRKPSLKLICGLHQHHPVPVCPVVQVYDCFTYSPDLLGPPRVKVFLSSSLCFQCFLPGPFNVVQPLNVPVSTGPQTIKSVKWRYSIISNGDFPKTNTHVDEHNDFSGWSFFMTKFFQKETS